MIGIVWYISLVAVGIALIGSTIILKELRRVLGSFKRSLATLSAGAGFAILTSLILAVFGIMELQLTSNLWNIFLISYSLSMILFAVSMYSLYKTIGNFIVEMKGKSLKFRYSEQVNE